MKQGTKFDRDLQADRERVRRGVYKPTEQMEKLQADYRKLLEDRKKGITPLYTRADGRTYP